jgi:hypothetical protein
VTCWCGLGISLSNLYTKVSDVAAPPFVIARGDTRNPVPPCAESCAVSCYRIKNLARIGWIPWHPICCQFGSNLSRLVGTSTHRDADPVPCKERPDVGLVAAVSRVVGFERMRELQP